MIYYVGELHRSNKQGTIATNFYNGLSLVLHQHYYVIRLGILLPPLKC